MSAEKSTDWLIDLLYEDELELDDEPTSLDQLEPAQAAELEATRQWLGQARAAMLLAEPKASTREAILAAAQEQLRTQAETEAQAQRMPQPARQPSQSNLWARARFSTVAQITSLATVLVVGVFLLGRFQDQMPAATRSDAAAPTVALAPAPSAAAPMEELAAAAPTEADDQALALAPAKPITGAAAPADFPEVDPQQLAQTREGISNSGPLALADEKPKLDKEDPVAAWDTLPAKSSKAKSAEQRQEPPDELAANKDSAPGLPELSKSERRERAQDSDGFGFAGDTKEALKPQAANQKTVLSYNDTAPVQQDKAEAAMEPSPAPAPSRFMSPESPSKKGNARVDDLQPEYKNAVEDSTSSGAARPTATQPQAMPKAEADAAPAAADDAGEREAVESAKVARAASKKTATTSSTSSMPTAKPATPSVTIAEQALRAERFNDAATEADRFLKTGRGTPDERARALEIKAQAYERLGRGDDAYRVYEQLERDYPAYFKKKALDRPQKRPRKKDSSKSKIDLMESF